MQPPQDSIGASSCRKKHNQEGVQVGFSPYTHRRDYKKTGGGKGGGLSRIKGKDGGVRNNSARKLGAKYRYKFVMGVGFRGLRFRERGRILKQKWIGNL